MLSKKLNTLSIVLSALFVSSASADLKTDFNSINGYRGPYGKNVIQSTGARINTAKAKVVGKRLFQGGFRSNTHGRALARKYNFYIGNLLPSNYYELMHDYVFRSKYGLDYGANDKQDDDQYYKPHRVMDDAALIKNGKAAMPKAYTMARHTVLERYYMKLRPTSTLTKSSLRWGIGDSADESVYAEKFFNFYLSSITSDLQFTPLFFLLRESPVGDSGQMSLLERARKLVYDFPNDYKTELGRIRNAIHNQLTPSVIKMIDNYQYRYGRNSTLTTVRGLLVEFYSFKVSKIARIASKQGFKGIANAANAIDKSPTWAPVKTMLLELSEEMARLKTVIADNKKVPSAKKTDALVLLSYTTQLLNSRMTNTENYRKADLSSKEGLLIVLNILYAEGLLIEKNWKAFKAMLSKTNDHRQQATIVSKAVKIGTDTVMKSFKEPLDQWKSIDSKMANFIDSAVKSSGLNTASVVLQMVN